MQYKHGSDYFGVISWNPVGVLQPCLHPKTQDNRAVLALPWWTGTNAINIKSELRPRRHFFKEFSENYYSITRIHLHTSSQVYLLGKQAAEISLG